MRGEEDKKRRSGEQLHPDDADFLRKMEHGRRQEEFVIAQEKIKEDVLEKKRDIQKAREVIEKALKEREVRGGLLATFEKQGHGGMSRLMDKEDHARRRVLEIDRDLLNLESRLKTLQEEMHELEKKLS